VNYSCEFVQLGVIVHAKKSLGHITGCTLCKVIDSGQHLNHICTQALTSLIPSYLLDPGVIGSKFLCTLDLKELQLSVTSLYYNYFVLIT